MTNSEELNRETKQTKKSDKKTFKEYLFEGLMIFVAVSMGFIAENIRDRLSEKEVEKRNIELVVENLKDDVAKLDINIQYNQQKVLALDTLISFRDIQNRDTLNSRKFSHLMTKCIYNPAFFSNTAAIDQMKSSGTLRLIKNPKVLMGIYRYESMNKRLATIRDDIDSNDERMIEYSSFFLDMKKVASSRGVQFLQTNDIQSQDYFERNKQPMYNFFNHAVLYKSILEIIMLPHLYRQQKSARELVEFLQSEYGIEDKE